MSYRTRRADLMSEDDVDHLRELHTMCFGDSAPMPDFDSADYGAWWLVFPVGKEDPVAFAGIVPSSYGPGVAYHKRAGVITAHQGHGLQRRLIRMRELWARKNKFMMIVTDTFENCPSSNNLIRCGYKLFNPVTPWGFTGSLYFKKNL